MSNARSIRSIAFAILACLGVAHAEGDAKAGKQKSEACAGCHGVDGNPQAPMFPKLAGQHFTYLSRQLQDFKSKKRVDQVMNAMVESLSDADIADISAWYASQKRTTETVESNALGEKIFRIGLADKAVPACSGCHAPTGSGNRDAGYPALAGQYASYLAKVLNDYKGGERSNDPNAIMRTIASRMDEQQINAVADFLSGLH